MGPPFWKLMGLALVLAVILAMLISLYDLHRAVRAINEEFRRLQRDLKDLGLACTCQSHPDRFCSVHDEGRQGPRHPQLEAKTPAQRAAAKVLRDPAQSKRAKTGRGKALTQR